MKLFKRATVVVVFGGIIWFVYFAWRTFPIIGGYGAKRMCSCVFVGLQQEDSVVRQELRAFPLSLGRYSVHYGDSTATGSVFGLFSRKAIFRKGLGCTLLSEVPEATARKQQFQLTTPIYNRVADSLAWPLGDKIDTSLKSDFDSAALQSVMDSAFYESGGEPLRRTRALVVVYKGQIIGERYANGFTNRTRFAGWSMGKSLLNSVIGVMVKEGRITVESGVDVPSWKQDGRNTITWKNLLNHNSGIQWEEDYGGASDVTNMLYKHADMGNSFRDNILVDEPGKRFAYTSGGTNLLSSLVREKLGDSLYHRYPYEKVFRKIGMNSMVLESDVVGNFVYSSYAFATARDWARFGLLYCNDGVFNGERILPEDWVAFSAYPAKGTKYGQYGGHFWSNAGAAGKPEDRYYRDAPPDMFWANGFESQYVYIVPSRQLVVVKLSLTQGNYLDENKFLAGVLTALR